MRNIRYKLVNTVLLNDTEFLDLVILEGTLKTFWMKKNMDTPNEFTTHKSDDGNMMQKYKDEYDSLNSSE